MKIFLDHSQKWATDPLAGLSSLDRMKAGCLAAWDMPPKPWPIPDEVFQETTLWLKGLFPLLERQDFTRIMSLEPDADVLWIAPKDRQDTGVLRLGRGQEPPKSFNHNHLASQYQGSFSYFETAEPSWQPLENGEDFSLLNQILFQRNAHRAMSAGVCLVAPQQTWIEDEVTLTPGVWLGPSVFLGKGTRIERDVQIHQGCWLRDVEIGEGAVLRPYSVLESSKVGKQAAIGPFAHVRPGTVLGEQTRVGNFVETKNAVLGDGSKASHLSYLGDTTIGENCNIGAGTITCNYDGFNKWQTSMGDGVFIGSNTELVAPVTIGDGALVAAGSTVTKDVPANSLAISRSKQINKEGRAARIFEKAQKAGK